MTDFTSFHHVIHERITSPGARYYEDPWWDEELYWLGEVFDDIIDAPRSAAFLEALCERAKRVDNPQWRSEIEKDIRTAHISECVNLAF